MNTAENERRETSRWATLRLRLVLGGVAALSVAGLTTVWTLSAVATDGGRDGHVKVQHDLGRFPTSHTPSATGPEHPTSR